MRSKALVESKVHSERKNPNKIAKKLTKKHLQTPTKSKIWTLWRNHSQTEIARIFREEDNITVSQSRISKIVREEDHRRVGNSAIKPETRGRKRKFNETELNSVETVLDTHDDVRWMTWNQIASTSEIGDLMGDYEHETLRDTLAVRGRGKFNSVTKDEIPNHTQKSV